ncbi:unnamed protein product [Paramecium sonneborni]|uniref:Uncharacterized protein n=1 Tax=Paramecium sonneborni TaxID=65129 RepID=A0A8S1NLY0_9CILI|nr:unnamed protein product [Paramecium sonneborni]
MKSSILLTCCYEEHENSQIIGVCTNINCKHTRTYCIACKPQFHQEHNQDLVRFNDLANWVKSRKQLIQPINELINQVQQFSKSLKSLVGNVDYQSQTDFESLNNSELHDYIKQLILLEKSQVLLVPKIKFLIQQQEKLKKEIESLILNKELCQSQVLSLEEIYFSSKIICTDSRDDEDIKIEEQKEIDKCLKYQIKFSQELKHEEIQILQNQLIAQGDCFALCEPTLPTNTSTKFAFKCHEEGIYIGICHIDLIQKAQFNPKLKQLKHGAYLISSNGYVYSHLEKEINSSKKSFTYGKNDIIQVLVQVEDKKITWIKQSTNEEFSMKFESVKDLCPCVQLWGKTGTQVEIIDF